MLTFLIIPALRLSSCLFFFLLPTGAWVWSTCATTRRPPCSLTARFAMNGCTTSTTGWGRRKITGRTWVSEISTTQRYFFSLSLFLVKLGNSLFSTFGTLILNGGYWIKFCFLLCTIMNYKLRRCSPLFKDSAPPHCLKNVRFWV